MKNKIFGKAEIMGVLNVTPDSFSDGSQFSSDTASATNHFLSLIQDGADIIDVGGVSTKPGSKPISSEEEIARLSLVLNDELEGGSHLGIKISVDTYRASVAVWGLKKGVSIINDVSALRADPEMAEVVSSSGSEIVLMYARESSDFPHASSSDAEYSSVIDSVSAFFEERIRFAVSRGIKETNIILDPGMGAFLSPNHQYSWDIVGSAKLLKQRFSNFRLLYGVSRKGFIRATCSEPNVDFISKLVEFDLVRNNIDIIRTHNVALLMEMSAVVNKIG